MKKYLIDYQLEDEEPDHIVIESHREESVKVKLESKIFEDYIQIGLTGSEAQIALDQMMILEIKEI